MSERLERVTGIRSNAARCSTAGFAEPAVAASAQTVGLRLLK